MENQSDRLGRKIELARQRAERERISATAGSTLAPEKFERDDHRIDGTIAPRVDVNLASRMPASHKGMVAFINPVEKPPLGLIPRKLHNQHRILSIDQAIARYTKAGKEIPVEWEAERWALLRGDWEHKGMTTKHGLPGFGVAEESLGNLHSEAWEISLARGCGWAAATQFPSAGEMADWLLGGFAFDRPYKHS